MMFTTDLRLLSMLTLLLLAIVSSVSGKAVSGEKVKIGDISSLHHAVSGELFALNENTLMVENFTYDGAGPDAFFWVGKEGRPENTNEDTTAILAHPFKGKHYKYRNKEAPLLGASANEAVTLILPGDMKVTDIKWLSVWCRKFSMDFGNMIFPADVQLPGSLNLPAPLAPPTNDLDAKAEPEPESESESEPGYEHDSNSVDAEPESEPSTKSEPEPEPHGAGSIVGWEISKILILIFLTLSIIL